MTAPKIRTGMDLTAVEKYLKTVEETPIERTTVRLDGGFRSRTAGNGRFGRSVVKPVEKREITSEAPGVWGSEMGYRRRV